MISLSLYILYNINGNEDLHQENLPLPLASSQWSEDNITTFIYLSPVILLCPASQEQLLRERGNIL